MRRHTRGPHVRIVVGFVIVCGLIGGNATPAMAASTEEIAAAIKKGREYLLSVQHPSGRWEKDERRNGNEHKWETMQGTSYGGFSAIATYALLASGMDQKDPRLARALQFLKKADINGCYAAGLRAQVWLYLPETPERRALAARDYGLLWRTLKQSGNAKGLWDYMPNNAGDRIDHSVAQYGVLGFWACAQAGSAADNKTWQLIEDTWRAQQSSEGGWSYDGNGQDGKPVTASMTAAGVATLFITQDFLLNNAGILCKENPLDKNIDDGLKWMAANIEQVGQNPYAWYGVERIGMASGLKYFGDKDWYAVGAETLVRMQKPDGSWEGGFPGAVPIPATAYSVIFLSRGRAPTAINKLQYGVVTAEGKGSTWNQRPRDTANLTRYLGWKTEAEYAWQTVNLKVAATDLHDAPVLYIAGSGSVKLTDEEAAKVRQYVEDGGLILANANCGKVLFTRTLKQLVQQMFPKYEFRKLPADHPIFTKQQFSAEKWREKPEVEALGNGARELVVLIPNQDAGKAWQLRTDLKRADNEEKFQLGANVFAYATDGATSLVKGRTHVVKDAGGATPPKVVKVLRLDVGANPDPEPGGWRRLATIFKNGGKLALDVRAGKPRPEQLTDVAVAHLTGTSKFELSPAERAALKTFVEQGGTLVIDAAGGAYAFAESAEIELAAVFGDAAKAQLKEPLPAKHAVYQLPDNKIDAVGYRRVARETLVGQMKTPRLRGISVGDGKRVGVFFSREDLSVGLVGQEVYGVVGYSPESATKLMRNILLYAAQDGRGVTTTTTPAPEAVAGAPPAAPVTPADPPPAAPPEPPTPSAPDATAKPGEPLPF